MGSRPSEQYAVGALLRSREIGQARHGHRRRVVKQMYSAVKRVASWDPDMSVKDTHHGSIFNFDFSTDGSLLAAACERRSLLMFDPRNARLIHSKNDAHSDCVNCIRFLDSRTFATCSDDTTVCLWDARFLKTKVRSLEGHSNWVKNIDYARDLGLLMTSGFDGCICTWDINSYSDTSQSQCRRVFHTNGLMRSKLLPDASKLIIATAGGYLMVVHDLDLTRLPDDLAGFKPNMYRLVQMCRTKPRQGYRYDHLFTRKRNRVELISDFPVQDDAELISSLEVHPHGWCVCSRNTTNDEKSEWTCVHDIQGSLEETLADASRDPSKSDPEPSPDGFLPRSSFSCDSSTLSPVDLRNPAEDADGLSASAPSLDLTAPSTSLFTPGQLQIEVDDRFAADIPGLFLEDHNLTLSLRTPSPSSSVFRLNSPVPASEVLIRRNIPRLTYYIEEPNIGRGFIKELCFSPDGRLVCSPFAYGLRLLAFDASCRELCDTAPDSPRELHEVTSNMSHRREVVTVKFSPTECLLVSGCLDGRVDFHQPVL